MLAENGAHGNPPCFQSSSCLDHVLFRDAPQEMLAPDAEVTMHPVLQVTLLLCTSVHEATIFDFSAGPRHFQDWAGKPTVELAISSEHACTPSVRSLFLSMGKGGFVQSSTVGGVTVKEVIEAGVKLWAAKPPRYMSREAVKVMGVKEEEVNYIHCLYDHNGWAGWDNIKVGPRGVVVFKPSHFCG